MKLTLHEARRRIQAILAAPFTLSRKVREIARVTRQIKRERRRVEASLEVLERAHDDDGVRRLERLMAGFMTIQEEARAAYLMLVGPPDRVLSAAA
ncbi:MAG: hypothetical protein ACK4XJ_01960 [Fimbriimonadaceae bacterium]